MSKSCEYCNGEYLSSKPISDRCNCEVSIESIIDGEFLYNYHISGHKTVIKINYCPICGRNLAKEDN